jgi:hypothetical protein
MAPSANIGRILWPKRAKTHEINEMATKNPSNSFDIFTAYLPGDQQQILSERYVSRLSGPTDGTGVAYCAMISVVAALSVVAPGSLHQVRSSIGNDELDIGLWANEPHKFCRAQ